MGNNFTPEKDLLGIIDEIGPAFAKRSLDLDRDATFPTQNFLELRDAGLLQLTVPKSYGGYGFWSGRNYKTYYALLMKMAEYCGATAQLLQIHSHGVGLIAGNGTKEQLDRYMPEVVNEGKLFTSSGSEASVRANRAEGFDCALTPTPSGYSISGTKAFASLSAGADYYVVWTLMPNTRTMAEGLIFAVIPSGRIGVELVNDWDILGMRATVSWTIKLKDCAVDPKEVVGSPGAWVQKDHRTFTLSYAANHIGQGRAAYNYVREYLKNREDLRNISTIMTKYAENDVNLSAAESLIHRAAELWEQNLWAEAELASMRALNMAKRASLRMAMDAFELCGARSTFNDQPLGMYLRDLRTFTLHTREDKHLQLLAEADLTGKFQEKQRYGVRQMSQTS